MASGISGYWRDVFSDKSTPIAPAQAYIERFTSHVDLSQLQPPSQKLMAAVLRRLSHSAPGPDCIPYAGWQKTPQALE
eukprot:1200673-Pyramimonas_sp.AAC.1